MDQIKTPFPQCPQCEKNIEPSELLEDSSIFESFMHFVCDECGCHYKVVAIPRYVDFTVIEAEQAIKNAEEVEG